MEEVDLVRGKREWRRRCSVYILSLVALFCGFQWNLWRMAEETVFLTFCSNGESLVLGRIVQSRQAGILSAGGLPGCGTTTNVPATQGEAASQDKESIRFQYNAYLDRLRFGSYNPYMSQIAGQGLCFSVLDGLLDISPGTKLELFRAMVALLSASVLSLAVVWFYCECGLLVSLLVLGSCLVSPWMTAMGRNLWWCLGAFYLPMVLVMFYLRRSPVITGRRCVGLGGVVFAGLLVKCLFTGYEFITTAMIMTGVPLAYYAVLCRSPIGMVIKGVLACSAGAILAVVITAGVLCCQIAAVKGKPTAGIDHIWYSLKKRTYSDATNLPPVYAQSLKAGVGEVLSVYLDGVCFDSGRWLRRAGVLPGGWNWQVRYWHVILLFVAASCVSWVRSLRSRRGAHRDRIVAMILACWISVLAPLSWFVVFKAHSYIHTDLDCITWQMPFTIFGSGLVALAMRSPQGAEVFSERTEL